MYNVYQVKLCIGDTENAVAYDDTGQTAMDGIERQSDRENWSEIKAEKYTQPGVDLKKTWTRRIVACINRPLDAK